MSKQSKSGSRLVALIVLLSGAALGYYLLAEFGPRNPMRWYHRPREPTTWDRVFGFLLGAPLGVGVSAFIWSWYIEPILSRLLGRKSDLKESNQPRDNL